MKQQTTITHCKTFCFAAISVILYLLTSSNAYSQIYSNGPISTGATHVATSTAAPAGYTWSELQSPSGTLGFSCFYNNAATTDFSVAEEFVVPAGNTWNLTNINFYGYQTGYAGGTIPIDALRVRIWNGDPSVGGSVVVFGDMTTNVLNTVGSGEEMIYRVTGTTGTTRRIWRFNANVTTSLTEGTYWVEFQVHAINDSSIFMPPVTILGMQSDANWTAKQRNASTWAGLVDTGSTFNRSMPFQLIGSVLLSVHSNSIESNFTMYPMPVNDICNFKWNSLSETTPTKIAIYDTKGAKVQEQSIMSNTADFSVKMADLKAGMYFIKVYDKDGAMIYTNRLIKK